MTYQTFLSVRAGWRLYEGVGDRGRLIRQLAGAPWARHLAQTAEGTVWITFDPATVARILLPDLTIQPIPSPGQRIGAVTAEPFGERVLVVGLPDEPRGQVRLLGWESGIWRAFDPTPAVDISSSLAWLDERRVAYESVHRRLTVLDLDTGATEELFDGRLPCAASVARVWYAVSGGQVVQVSYEPPFEPRPVTGFQFGYIVGMSWNPDGTACLWKEPKFAYRQKGFAQREGGRRVRVRSLDEGLGVISLLK